MLYIYYVMYVFNGLLVFSDVEYKLIEVSLF